jgi:hypothetical protein
MMAELLNANILVIAFIAGLLFIAFAFLLVLARASSNCSDAEEAARQKADIDDILLVAAAKARAAEEAKK